MPARRSEDPSLSEPEKRGEGAREHWDPSARSAARPAPLQRSLPDRDNRAESAVAGADDVVEDPSLACEEDGDPSEAPDGPEATEK